MKKHVLLSILTVIALFFLFIFLHFIISNNYKENQKKAETDSYKIIYLNGSEQSFKCLRSDEVTVDFDEGWIYINDKPMYYNVRYFVKVK